MSATVEVPVHGGAREYIDLGALLARLDRAEAECAVLREEVKRLHARVERVEALTEPSPRTVLA